MKFKRKGAYAKAVARTTGLYQYNGVLLVRGNFTQEEVDEFNKGLVKPGTVHEWTKFLKDKHEPYQKIINDEEMDEKYKYSNRSSKEDLEEYGRTVGIELDRRKTKKSLLKQIKDFLQKRGK